MMNFWQELIENKVLVSAFIGWLVAQISKLFTHAIIHREWRWERLVGAGGMPSSHAATVCALTTSALLVYGVGSFAFAISLVLAIIVIHDARGVRLETGRQAAVLNQIIKNFLHGDMSVFHGEELKELVGHTPLQVFFGSIIGIAVGLLVCGSLYTGAQ